jgi:hypothetical protein
MAPKKPATPAGPAEEVLIVPAQLQRQLATDLVVVLSIEGQVALSQADLARKGVGAVRRSSKEQIAPSPR